MLPLVPTTRRTKTSRNPFFSRHRHRCLRAFTRIEALALLAGGALLLALGLPGLAGVRSLSTAQVCFGNQRQLITAWLLFAEDHAGRLPGNLDGGDAMNSANTNISWVVGWLDNSTFRPDNTNTVILRNSQLGPYFDSVSIFKCPSDLSLSRGRRGDPRVRSVAMNPYVGTRFNGSAGSENRPYTAGYRQFLTLASIVDPAPSKCFVFIEEREDSINDPWFPIDMSNYVPPSPANAVMVDYPGEYHDGGAVLSFVDGHVELWRWQDGRTRPALRPGQLLPLGLPSPNNPDVLRLQSAASSLVQR